ncbi:MAG TPA: hypothetical protein RMH26_06130, partial [Polyangiaceae bacterium LLY-WYZ-15_(1-7)]|nr:hypothetical protein [Polyangiaceae bacterium LLY-WYZ-15_(1-7)]
DELFEAIDHFRSAASLFFEKAASTSSKGLGEASKRVEGYAEKIDPAITKAVDKTVEKVEPGLSKASKRVEGYAEKIDPAFETATKEAERVIRKLGASAEPLAKQLTSELGKLTKRLGDAVDEATKKKSAPSKKHRPDDGD